MVIGEFKLEMIDEEERKRTFKHWPYKDSSVCNKQKMAEAGFFSSGKKSEADAATCFICYKQLDGWEEDDDPWKEHKKHAPYCPYIKLGKTPSDLTVKDVVLLLQQCMILKMKNINEERRKNLEQHAEEMFDLLGREQLKENAKPKGGVRRKRSSRK